MGKSLFRWPVFFGFLLSLSACAPGGLIDTLRRATAQTETRSQSKPPPAPLPVYRGPVTRPFLMGFTRWPADLTEEGDKAPEQYDFSRLMGQRT